VKTIDSMTPVSCLVEKIKEERRICPFRLILPNTKCPVEACYIEMRNATCFFF
jgi:hypothetical protein